MQDALEVNFINNTVMSNDTTASSGVLFNTLGAPDASAPNASPSQQTTSSTTSAPQPAGLVVMLNSPNLSTSLGGKPLTCPQSNPMCNSVSNPYLANDVFFQNRSFYIGVGSLSPQYQQNVVSLYNAFTNTPAANQPQAEASTANGNGVLVTGGTGACTSGASYWDIGVRGDTGPATHSSTITLAPVYSILTDAGDYPNLHNSLANPTFVSQYCNGSRTPPEVASAGYNVPPGISDATVPNPAFSLSPSATVDEGNNWINMTWGPLSLSNPVTLTSLGNYAPTLGSSVINYIPSTASSYGPAPTYDFYGNPRKANNFVDAGAVEYVGAALAIANVTGGPLAFGNVVVTTTSSPQTLTLHNTGAANLTGITVSFTGPYSRAGGTCGTTLAPASATPGSGSCTITVVFSPVVTGPAPGSAIITANVLVAGAPVSLSGTGTPVKAGATLTPATWSPSQTRNCPGTGLGVVACNLDPTQTFTLTNIGNTTLTGIAQGVLSGTNSADYAILHALSTCGPAGGGQLVSTTTLAPGGTCIVVVQFKPLTTEPAGTKSATIAVTDALGTQSSTITGTAK